MTDKKPKRPSKGRVFQCTGFPNCNKSFTRSEHLARHRRKHTGERPFTCSHCSKNFSRLDNLRQHKQTVHAYENYIKRRAEAHKEESASRSSTDSATDESSKVKSEEKVAVSEQNPQNSASQPHHQHLPPPPPPQQVYTPHAGQPLVSPPSSGSPPYGSVYYPSPYYAPVVPHPPAPPSGSGPGEFRPGALRALRDPPKFNPKSRPRPLSLVHSFTDDNFLPTQRRTDLLHPLANEPPPLRTAPPVASVAGASGVPLWSHLPAPASSRFAYLTPTMVSPLSPLFHQSFNQVAGAKASIGSAVGAAALTQLASGSGENSDPNAANASKAASLPPARLPAPSGKGWLRSIINEEKPPRVAIDSLIEPSEASSRSSRASE